ncbi:MAG: heat-inducible transcription repressor HrcA [Calditrichaeota bacterium]|nr:MAG: heat-inducible transcription repressor HrcA [Calditrichota bacterium]
MMTRQNITTNFEPLNEREKIILNCIVESYVKTATPVGSRYLAKKYNLSWSPATIRNVMNDLEEMGYLKQPHTSAGRVPTDKGYRFYVDSLISIEALQRKERRMILENLRKVSADVDEILHTSSQVLGKISSQLGVVLAPRFYQGIFQKMELVPISENKILIVISIESGLVKTIMTEIESRVSRDKLYETAWIINERLSGLSLKEIKDSIDRRMADISKGEESLIRMIIESSDKLFTFEEHKDVHVGGTVNIMSNPEFSDQEHLIKMLELIESKQIILHLFDEQGKADKISITIGEEHKDEIFRNCSVITTSYHIGNVTGTLGVVGPTRMQYAKIIPLVDYMGKVLSQLLSAQMK